ncbi:NAD(P)-dependent oxidoreductase [Balamuthia mandrillaris]
MQRAMEQEPEERAPLVPGAPCGGSLVVLGGCGHIGLTLSIRLALAGWRVAALDVDEEGVGLVNGGVMPFRERQGEELLAEALATGRLQVTTDPAACLPGASAVILTNGMEVGEAKWEELLQVFEKLVEGTKEDALYIFRSTLYPGTMLRLQRYLEERERSKGRPTGGRGRLAYCPERTAELFALEEIVQLPQIVSGCDEEAFAKTCRIFSTIAPTLIKLSPVEAEFAKLVTNAWRYIDFAIGNEFYKLLEGHNRSCSSASAQVDFFKVMNAITYDYPRASGFKKPGFCAGPCLLKDTRMLASYATRAQLPGSSPFAMGLAALETNEMLAEVAVNQLIHALTSSSSPPPSSASLVDKEDSKPLQGRIIGLLGMAFKADVDDIRQSLSFRVKKICRLKGAVVMCHDPYVSLRQGLKDMVSLDTLLERSDGIILCTPHECYKNIKLKDYNNKAVLVDVWNFISSSQELEILPGTKPLPSPSSPSSLLLSSSSSATASSAVACSSPSSSLHANGIQQYKENAEAKGNDKATVLVTGSAGFIGGYLVQELLQHGYRVIGIDNFSKYGKVEREYDQDPNYELHQGDAKDVQLLKRLAERCDYIVACAAMIGGISYFHALAYDLLAENERIIAATFDAAIHAFQQNGEQKKKLKKIIVLSSSMVFEGANTFPTPEGEQERCPPPMSTYGFQKLACEYYAKGAWEQYKLPFTIVRPFNCVGVGERRALRKAAVSNGEIQLEKEEEVSSGNIKLAMSHVVPDLIQKLLKGQDPLHILGDGKQVRHYTYGGDLAKGIRMCIESPAALNQDFNISTATSTTVLELAELVWQKIHGDAKPFRWVSDPPFRYDVQMRVPDCSKAKELLGFEATTSLSDILDELIPWIQHQIKLGNM